MYSFRLAFVEDEWTGGFVQLYRNRCKANEHQPRCLSFFLPGLWLSNRVSQMDLFFDLAPANIRGNMIRLDNPEKSPY